MNVLLSEELEFNKLFWPKIINRFALFFGKEIHKNRFMWYSFMLKINTYNVCVFSFGARNI